MALKPTTAQGIKDRPGYFTNVGVLARPEEHPLTYRMSPKYNDPYTSDSADRKMAKFIMGSDLAKVFKKAAGGSTDGILDVLGSVDQRGYFDFFLQSADEAYNEKYQIVETLGDSYAAFGLGRRPLIFSYGGVLLNAEENDWRVNFIRFFDKYGSISRLSKAKTSNLKTSKEIKNVITLVYDGVQLNGALLDLKTTLRAANEMVVPFAFSMLVTGSSAFNIKELSASRQDTESAGDVVPIRRHAKTEAEPTAPDNSTMKKGETDLFDRGLDTGLIPTG